MSYVELHCHSAYSFLDGASQPEELAARAAELGYEALALTDHDGVYGSLEFAHAAKAFGVRPITGAEVTLADGSHVTLLVETPQGYANLCRLLTAAHARHPAEGRPSLLPPSARPAPARGAQRGLVCLSGCARHGLGVRNPNARRASSPRRSGATASSSSSSGRTSAATRAGTRRCATWRETLGVPTVATGDVHAHHERGRGSRTRSSRSSTAPRSTAAERERRGNHESVLLAPEEMPSASRTTATPSRAPSSSPSGSSST